MKIKNLFCSVLLFGSLTGPLGMYAQQEPDDIKLAKDDFEDNFYEALMQKGIENYDKAIVALQKCLAKQPDSPAVYNELAKNYFAQKNYIEAEKSYKKASELDPKNRWYWQGLYDVYYETKDFNRAIPVVQKLMEWRKEYYEEDLVSLYMYTQQYDKALAAINEMDQIVGMSERREMYKLQILADSKNAKPKKEALEEAIKKDPKNETNYIDLIYLYSESNQEAKAEEVARRLEKEIPTSDWAQVSLFKFHLNNKDGDKATQSMFQVLGSKKIDSKIKHRVLNEYLIFVNNNPQYAVNLDKAVGYFDNDREVNVAMELGKYFFNKQKYPEAAKYIEKGLDLHPDDVAGAELLLYTYAESAQNEKMLKKATEYIDLYPTQPALYYYAGLAANRLQQFAKAKDYLESGLDFVVNDAPLTTKFKQQLDIAKKGGGKSR
jgi:tetratricopeptide (TPR) repeat protein